MMRAHPGRVVVKVGAEGVYCGVLTQEGHGIALKVEDGHTVAAALAMAAVLAELGLRPQPPGLLSHLTVNTRGETVGEVRVNGGLERGNDTGNGERETYNDPAERRGARPADRRAG